MLALFAAAAVTIAPVPRKDLVEDADMRCLAGFTIVLGLASDGKVKANAVEVAGIMANIMYYIGKLDERYGQLDYAVEMGRLISAENYAKRVDQDLVRCGAEAQSKGKSIQDWGKRLQEMAPILDAKKS